MIDFSEIHQFKWLYSQKPCRRRWVVRPVAGRIHYGQEAVAQCPRMVHCRACKGTGYYAGIFVDAERKGGIKLEDFVLDICAIKNNINATNRLQEMLESALASGVRIYFQNPDGASFKLKDGFRLISLQPFAEA